MSAEVAEGLPPDLIPEGTYKARLVDRRYGSDTWEIVAPGTPYHGRKVYIHPQEITAQIKISHLTISLPSNGSQTIAQGRFL